MAGIIAPQYQDEDRARKHLESIRWPEGPICPHCGVIDEAYKLDGESTRKSLYKCASCREPFTVTVGTIFEDSLESTTTSESTTWINIYGVRLPPQHPQTECRCAVPIGREEDQGEALDAERSKGEIIPSGSMPEPVNT